MTENELPHRLVARMGLDELIGAIRGSRYQNRRCVEAFLKRCYYETANSPKDALPLLVEAPDYVRRSRRALEPNSADYLIRAFGLLGTGLALYGSNSLAIEMFDKACSVEGADPFERASLKCRIAWMELDRGNWQKALDLASEALPVFQSDTGSLREDRSLATVLVARGAILGFAYMAGGNVDPDDALRDFYEVLNVAPAKLKRMKLAAVAGINLMAVRMWFEGRSTRFANPANVVKAMANLRNCLRRDGVSQRSMIDAKARWILGLASYKLLGGLGEYAIRHLTEARNVLIDVGSPVNVVEITLDFQWCLVEQGRWARALEEWRYIEERIDVLPEKWHLMVTMWGESLRKRAVSSEIAKTVFREIRGVRDLAVPSSSEVEDKALIGW